MACALTTRAQTFLRRRDSAPGRGDYSRLAAGKPLGKPIKGRVAMPKFLIEASYTAEGLKGLMKDKAAGRTAALTAALESVGGKLDAIYWSLGDADVYL